MRGPTPTLWLKIVVVVAALAALWFWFPVPNLTNPDELKNLVAPVIGSPWLPLYVLGAFLVAGALFLSVWLVVLQTSLLFAPLAAFPLALVGALLSATFFFALGRLLGDEVVTRFAPAKVQAAVRGARLESIIAVRLLPVFPFTAVNLCCGAFGVRPAVFVGGTVIGMAPGILGVSLLGESLLSAIQNPTPSTVGLVVVGASLFVATALLLRRRAERQTPLATTFPTPISPSDPSPPAA